MKKIMFDVGNVILKADHRITHDILKKYGVPEENTQNFYNNPDYMEFSRGRISGNDFYRSIVEKHVKFQLTYEQVVKAHDNHIYEVDSEVLDIVSRLSDIAVLTNTNEWQTLREKELVDLGKYSKKILRSHEMGMLKTDEGCFEKVIKELGIEPDKIIFIDDNRDNIEMAGSAGIECILFTDAKSLEKELKSKRIL